MRRRITLGILAGGKASRLGGLDKAAASYRGQTLLARTLAAMGCGFDQILVSHNGDFSALPGAGCRFLPDLRPGDHGPLAGIESLLCHTRSEWLLTVPVDLRDVPPALCEAMAASGSTPASSAGIVIRDGDGLQPLLALWPVESAREQVSAALDAGQLAVHRLQSAMAFSTCDISPWQLGNLNSPSDFE